MSVNKAIILAAGVGSRLRPLTDDRPKCLLEVGGRTILEHQILALERCGITDIVMVVGYLADRIGVRMGTRLRYITNARYEETNSLYSLWLAREELAAGSLVMNSDVFAVPELFARLLRATPPDAILVELGEHFEAEDMKVMLNGGHVVDFGKDLPEARAHAHNVGMAKFSREGATHLIDCLDRLVAAGHENDWAPLAFKEFARQRPLVAVPTDGLPWIEIDFADDLRRAIAEVGPAIAELEKLISA